jgi:hypothetical protein
MHASTAEAYKALCRGFYIESQENGDPFPVISDFHREGVVVLVHSSRSKANELAQELSEAYGQKGVVRPISSLWDTVTHLARRGVAGVMLDDKHPVFFMNRLSDVNRSLPTVCRILSVSDTRMGESFSSDSIFFGVRGPLKVEEASLLPWQNFRAMDAMSVRWMLSDRPLPESPDLHTILSGIEEPKTDCSDLLSRLVLFHNGATLLGPYTAPMGAVPVFSSKQWAEFFGVYNGFMEFRENAYLPNGQFSVQPVRGDFIDFLNAIHARHSVLVDVGLNPACHRFRQGYFFKQGDDWFLKTLAGVFALDEGTLKRRDDITPNKDDDAGGRSSGYEIMEGMHTLVRFPFKRLLGATQSLVPEAEAEQIVKEDLDAIIMGDYEIPESNQISGDSFVLDGFDKISGDTISNSITGGEYRGPLIFSDILQATSWLIVNFIDLDEETRVNGAKTCHGPFFPGSNDADAESAKSTAFIQALLSCLVDALKSGYRPEHCWHIQRLFQDVSAVLEVRKFGYLADLLHSEDELLGEFGERAPELLTRLKSIKASLQPKSVIDPLILSDLRMYLGQTAELLSDGSLQVLSAAIEEMKRVGKRPAYDYAGVSMKLCKAVERELKYQLFDVWCKDFRQKKGKKGVDELREESKPWSDRTGSTALDLLAKRQKVELGGMRYLLRAVAEGSNHPAIREFGSFLDSFGGRDWLVSNEFDEALARVSSRYRNGGVHEHLVEFGLCSEALDFLIRSSEAILPKLLRALVRTQTNPN